MQTYYVNVKCTVMHKVTFYPLRFPSADSVGGKILNMFNTESRLTLLRVGRQLWRVDQC